MQAGEMLMHAKQLVDGPRAKDYGDKVKNHARIAELWTMWLQETGRDVSVDPYDIAIMMMMVKMSRLMQTPGHSDCHVDIAGYASIAEEISTAKDGEGSASD